MQISVCILYVDVQMPLNRSEKVCDNRKVRICLVLGSILFPFISHFILRFDGSIDFFDVTWDMDF